MQKDNDGPIKFYGKTQQWGIFSNFYQAQTQQNGIKYPTNEHYFQSKKFAGKQWQMQIAKVKAPAQAFKMGQSRQHTLRQDWNDVKQKIMYDGLKLKFTQHKNLKQQLLSTGKRHIIEHTNKDHYWGDGLGKGKNRLGELLMQLREQLRKQQIK